jgi:hypothetical protein
MSLIGLLVFCLRCFSVPLRWVSAHSELGIQFRGITIQSRLELSERSSLYLVCVLQFTDPLSLFSLQSCHFPLDLHALLVFLVDLADKLLSLVQTLLFLLHHTHLNSLVFLVAHHLLHALGLKLFSSLLDLNHFLVLGTLCLQALSLTVVLLGLSHLLAADGLFLVKTVLLVAHLKFALLLFTLDLQGVLVVGSFSISVTYVNDVVSFLLGLLDLLPCLLNTKRVAQ